MEKKKSNRLETRLKPGQTFTFKDGMKLTNIGDFTAILVAITPIKNEEYLNEQPKSKIS